MVKNDKFGGANNKDFGGTKMDEPSKFKNFDFHKYDKLDKRRKLPMDKHSKNLCVKLTESEFKALQAIKMYYNKTYSDMIRDSILFLNNYYNVN